MWLQFVHCSANPCECFSYRDIKDTTVGTLSQRITNQLMGLKGLCQQLNEIHSYLDKVASGQLPVNHQIIYLLQVRRLTSSTVSSFMHCGSKKQTLTVFSNKSQLISSDVIFDEMLFKISIFCQHTSFKLIMPLVMHGAPQSTAMILLRCPRFTQFHQKLVQS